MAKKKTVSDGKSFIIVSLIFLISAVMSMNAISFVIALIFGFLAYKRNKEYKAEIIKQKSEQEQQNALNQDGQEQTTQIKVDLKGRAKQIQKEEQEKAERRRAYSDLISKGIYPALQRADFDFNNIVVVDTETTGFSPGKDEMLQLSITDTYGNELFNHYLKPLHRRAWSEAEKVNGISPAMVKEEKHIEDYKEEVTALLHGKTIVGYNIDFDADFLKAAGLVDDNTIFVDVMKPFAEINGEYNYRHNDYTWKKLTDCAKYYGYVWEEKAHNSLADCKATAFCFRKMCGRD